MNAIWRIIDANANRAREGLRVLEDVARFALDDGRISGDLKSVRHALASALDACDPGSVRRFASRDTEGDVGTEITSAGEYERASLLEVVSANAKRVQESLRAIEEASKALRDCVGVAQAIERARYETYEIERTLSLRVRARTVPSWPLCVIVTRSLCAHMSWQSVIRAAAEGGATCFQLREKDSSSRELSALAREFVAICKEMGVCSIINDRADIALPAGADGVHVGLDDPPIAQVMKTFGDRLLIGASCPSIAHAKEAIDAGAHSLGVGAMFETNTKKKDSIAGPAFLEEVLALPGCPHALAIGGIVPANIDAVVDAGAKGVAVSSAVCGAEDPSQMCGWLLNNIQDIHKQ